MMLKCADGSGYMVSPVTTKKWAWGNSKKNVPGTWSVNGKPVQCGEDASFDALQCGWGFGCSSGSGGGDVRLLPGVHKANQCVSTSSAGTNGVMTICGSANYGTYQIYVRAED